MITEEREMIVQAVISGELDPNYLTLDEVQEVELLEIGRAHV